MKTYRDIYREAYGFLNQKTESYVFQIVNLKVLVWSQDYEQAIFDIDDEIHPNTFCVWFEIMNGNKKSIHKSVKNKGKWEEIEHSIGSIPYSNNPNPFEPEQSVFHQNQ